jgi:hypothetical protein
MERASLYLPSPAQLDDMSVVSSPIIREVAQAFLRLAPLAPTENCKSDELLKRVTAELAAINAAIVFYYSVLEPAPTSSCLNNRQKAFDAHFRQARVEGNTADLLVAATIQAFCNFFEDQLQGTSLLPLEMALLFATTQSSVEFFIAKEGPK